MNDHHFLWLTGHESGRLVGARLVQLESVSVHRDDPSVTTVVFIGGNQLHVRETPEEIRTMRPGDTGEALEGVKP